MTGEAERAALIDRYRRAYAAANKTEAPLVAWARQRFRLVQREGASAFTRPEFESAILTLERRAAEGAAAKSNAGLFTPRHAVTDERLRLQLSDGGETIRRGKWRGIVTDDKGRRWLAWGAPCGARCYCDAQAIEVRDLDVVLSDTIAAINAAFEGN